MSSVFVQIGQCGCQIGSKLNKKLSNSYYSTRIYPPNKIHSIMIDTQPKVLKPFIDNPPKYLDTNNIKYFQYGRGNNWSYGYMHQLPISKQIVTQFVDGHKQFSHLTKKQKQQRISALKIQSQENIKIQPIPNRNKSRSPISKNNHSRLNFTPQKQPNQSPKKYQFHSSQKKSKNQPNLIQKYPSLTQFQQKVLINKYLKQNKQICQYTLQRIRKQLDTTDCPLYINILCSLGGGTGSGLGTKIIQKVYQQFNMDIYAHVVLPNKSGQTPLQIYNCTLSLASIVQHSTAIFTYQNDNMINTFLQYKQNQSNNNNGSFLIKGTDLDFINQQISQIQANFIKINDLQNYNRFYGNIVNQCILSNQMKFVTLFGSNSNTSMGMGTNQQGNKINHMNSNVEELFGNSFQNLCQQLRIYNQDLYQIQDVINRRQKCLANSMIITTTGNTNNSNNNMQLMQQHHRKKLKNIINPISYNSQLNIQTIQSAKKSINNTNNLNTTSITNKTNINNNSNPHNKCQISLLMNHSNILRYMQYLSVAGRKKYEAKAYLWHYKYADLQNAFASVQNIIDQYYYATTDI